MITTHIGTSDIRRGVGLASKMDSFDSKIKWQEMDICAADVPRNVNWSSHYDVRFMDGKRELLVLIIADDRSIGYQNRISSYLNGTRSIRNYYSSFISNNARYNCGNTETDCIHYPFPFPVSILTGVSPVTLQHRRRR